MTKSEWWEFADTMTSGIDLLSEPILSNKHSLKDHLKNGRSDGGHVVVGETCHEVFQRAKILSELDYLPYLSLAQSLQQPSIGGLVLSHSLFLSSFTDSV